MIDDLGDVIAELATDSGEPDGLYQLTRGTAPVDDGHGRYQDGPPGAVLRVVAGVQPLEPRMVQALPEGERAEDSRTVFVVVDLYAADAATGRTGDVLQVKEEDFEIREVYDWRADFGFVKARAVKVRR